MLFGSRSEFVLPGPRKFRDMDWRLSLPMWLGSLRVRSRPRAARDSDRRSVAGPIRGRDEPRDPLCHLPAPFQGPFWLQKDFQSRNMLVQDRPTRFLEEGRARDN